MRATDKSSTRLYVADQPSLRLIIHTPKAEQLQAPQSAYTTLAEARKSMGLPPIQQRRNPRLYVTR